ncbi:Methyltransferase domain protein [Labrenzia sp. THAF191b]|uniref:class I SAM-dependent methyltransferase n=1 Tax=unclassified Labrenzia TaxID=2648686 RepID=UPI001267F1B9|nr:MULTISPECIES: class I SAM-dependent methyltransferase [unclassified Labrenzia]QFT01065.1 Methyltransferase domain protein [Labrenzia sp. THAF191b]QFT07378.1 Methyltransferase domain protein [Labrenzia sp. THAF191a]QFT18922.1 Methyltransferase domain protein [Labrenzia sp. THAF187b]
MPDVEWNKKYWNEEYQWPMAGEEWSKQWGGAQIQWWSSIAPRIGSFLPANTILEIAPGYGRWTKFLLNNCKHYKGFDLSINALEYCKNHYFSHGLAASREFTLTNGYLLPGVGGETIDFVFSFDSLVHAEMDVIESYISEISRILKHGAHAFIHHSNYADVMNSFEKNTARRGVDVSAARFKEVANKHGLTATVQEKITWDSEQLQDCFTLLSKNKEALETEVLENYDFWREAGLAPQKLAMYHRDRT